MININKIFITKDGNTLVVSARVKNSSDSADGVNYWSGVTISKIVIDSSTTRVENGPSSSPVYTYTATNTPSEITINIPTSEILTDTDNDMLFVYIVTAGTPKAGVPCGMDKQITESCVVNLYKIYQQSLPYVKRLGCKCCISKDFVNLLLQIKGLEIAIKTNHYDTAIKLWNEFFKDSQEKVSSNCGCHG